MSSVPSLPIPPRVLKEQAAYNLCAAAEEEQQVFGSERPGFIRPSRDTSSTPRGPQVSRSVVEAWLKHVAGQGIRRILCLLTCAELSFYEDDLLALYRQHVSDVKHVDPLAPGCWTAASVLGPLQEAREAGEAIVVQCGTGQARSGAVLALWLHHRFLLPLPLAIDRISTYSTGMGAVRLPSLESVMELLLALPYPSPPSPDPALSLRTTMLPPRRPPRERALHVTCIQTGGTIDKDYPRAMGGYAFEIGDAACGRVLSRMGPLGLNLNYDVVCVCRKDSQDIDDDDRQRIVEGILAASSPLVVVTHGTDTMLQTAMHIKEAGAGTDKVVVLTGAHKPHKFIDSDAEFNLGQAFAAVQTLQPGVYVCMSGRVLEASFAKRDSQGLFCSR